MKEGIKKNIESIFKEKSQRLGRQDIKANNLTKDFMINNYDAFFSNQDIETNKLREIYNSYYNLLKELY